MLLACLLEDQISQSRLQVSLSPDVAADFCNLVRCPLIFTKYLGQAAAPHWIFRNVFLAADVRGKHQTYICLPQVQEINDLQALSMPEHLNSSRIAQAMKARYPITLCSYSHEVLLHFLQGSRLYLILGIINDHLKIKV